MDSVVEDNDFLGDLIGGETPEAASQPTDSDGSQTAVETEQREEGAQADEQTGQQQESEVLEGNAVKAEDKPPVHDKTLQSIQQEMGNLRRMVTELRSVPATQQQAAADKIDDALADVEARLTSDDFDPLESKAIFQSLVKEVKNVRKSASNETLQKEVAELRAKLDQRERAEQDRKYWNDFSTQYPEVNGPAEFQKEIQKFVSRGYSEQQAIDMASEIFVDRFPSKPHKPQQPKPTSTAVRTGSNTPAGTRIVQQAGVRHARITAEKSPEQLADDGELDIWG